MRRTVPLLASMALMVLLACGVALAASIACPTAGNGLCFGTARDDTMTGTDAYDRMYGRGGADTMRGGYFEDAIVGQGGDDTIYGQGGRGNLYGDSLPLDPPTAGDDYIIGGPVRDHIRGGPGSDRIRGNPGDDNIEGQEGDDRIWGGLGNDQIWADGYSCEDCGRDVVHGGDGIDNVSGGSGEIYGEAGSDRYLGAHRGDTVVHGGAGDDNIVVGSFTGQRVGYTYDAYGGPGEDEIEATFADGRGAPAPDELNYHADDGERDTIVCWNKKNETVVADRQDAFRQLSFPEYGYESARKYCDSLTIVE